MEGYPYERHRRISVLGETTLNVRRLDIVARGDLLVQFSGIHPYAIGVSLMERGR